MVTTPKVLVEYWACKVITVTIQPGSFLFLRHKHE